MATFELDRLASYDDEALLVELRRVAALVESPFLTQSMKLEHETGTQLVLAQYAVESAKELAASQLLGLSCSASVARPQLLGLGNLG